MRSTHLPSNDLRPSAALALLLSLVLAAAPAVGLAADPAKPGDPAKPAGAKPAETKPAKPAEKKANKGKTEPAAPEDLILTTDDGLRLAISYYRGADGKETIPVVLLHMWKQSRADYQDLALYLQSLGHAVIVPDLRGHGQSTRFKGAGKEEDLKAASMPPYEFANMALEDMNAVKEFLWERNNAGELNIDKLCVVGAEMGAIVAIDFAAYDAIGYKHGAPAYGPLKLGEFVKAIVLLSPEWSIRGHTLRDALATPRVLSDISLLIVVGKKDAKAASEAKRIENRFARFHQVRNVEDAAKQKTLFMVHLDTSLQGTRMLDPKLKVPEAIGEFINRRIVKPEAAIDWRWQERKRPHQ